MAIVNLNNIGEIGVITDVHPQELPDGAFSSVSNVRFADQAVQKIEGHSQVFGTPSITPIWLLPVQTPANAYWVYPGTDKVYTTDGSSHFNITRQTAAVDVDYSATLDLNWNGGVIGGIPILNNGVDDPQMWTPVQTSQRLQSLTWDGSNTWEDKVYKASVIRPYRDFLVALDVTKAGTRNTRLVMWSTSAVSGTVPHTWDKDDQTEDAGEFELSQSNGDCIDQAVLRDINIIYKDDSIWAMQYIGGQDIFRFYQIFGDVGILSRRCAKEFNGKHFVITNGDVIIHDGIQKQSVAEGKIRDAIFASIDTTNYQRTFVVPNYAKSEMWVCIPSSGATSPDHAHIWNWDTETWSERILPNSPHIAYGIINDSAAPTNWDADTQVWNDDTTVWDAKTFNPTDRKLLMAATNLYELDNTTQFAGVDFAATAERTGLHFGETDKIKYINAIWFRTSGTGTFTLTLGYQMVPNEPITWGSSSTYTLGTSKKINTRISGRYIAYRIQSTSDANWKVNNIGFDIKLVGKN
jgi:hypothetical protein